MQRTLNVPSSGILPSVGFFFAKSRLRSDTTLEQEDFSHRPTSLHAIVKFIHVFPQPYQPITSPASTWPTDCSSLPCSKSRGSSRCDSFLASVHYGLSIPHPAFLSLMHLCHAPKPTHLHKERTNSDRPRLLVLKRYRVRKPSGSSSRIVRSEPRSVDEYLSGRTCGCKGMIDDAVATCAHYLVVFVRARPRSSANG